MKINKRRIMGYQVVGKDEIIGEFATGVSRSLSAAKADYDHMMIHGDYSPEERKTFKIVRLVEVREEIVPLFLS